MPTIISRARVSGSVQPYWGAGISNDGLDNTRVGTVSGVTWQSAIVWKAQHTGTITDVCWYVIGGSFAGYSAGTGGKCVIDLCNVDGDNLPNEGSVIASTDEVTCPIETAEKHSVFASPPTITAGVRYALVWRNTDAAPGTNYYSTDNLLYQSDPAGHRPLNPMYQNDHDMKHLWQRSDEGSGVWQQGEFNVNDRPRTPIFDLTLGGGAAGLHEGSGYMEVSYIGSGGAFALMDGTNRVRMLLSMQETITVRSIGVRVARTSGSAALSLRLETSGGSEIETATIAAASIATHARPVPASNDRSGMYWYEVTLGTDRTLTSGSTYHLELSTTAGTEYWTTGSRRGPSWGYEEGTYFPMAGGRFQLYNGASWANGTNGTEDTLQFYFRRTA